MNGELRALFVENNGILKTKQLQENGIYFRKLRTLLESGEIELVKRGYYRLSDDRSFSDIPFLTSAFPEGVFCLDSALYCYHYTDRTPAEWHIAVPEGTSRKRFKIDYPPIKAHFVKNSKFYIGISEAEIDGFPAAVYDRERTICDVLYHRAKIDAEEYNASIQSYLKDDKKNISRLISYAQKLHVEKKVREVMGVWL